MIEYNVIANGLTLSPEIREYLERRLVHAEKLIHDEPAQFAIELQFTKTATGGGKYRAEYTLSLGRESLRAEARGETLHEAIDIAAAELTGELRRHKGKRLHSMRRQATRLKDFLRRWGGER